jgi:hypothetical protein
VNCSEKEQKTKRKQRGFKIDMRKFSKEEKLKS